MVGLAAGERAVPPGTASALRGDGAVCHHLRVRHLDDHHTLMLITEVRMSMTEVEAAYLYAAR
jgi:hypothetical protein